ncbi:unnamed protein product [Toxocara canis]|uniref:Uncharacterized protein n=1 Tax=Toxocara canis TaxID=6265 RepID=A0A183VBI7_TOXCA|nr:unnamed protein product [Toxocara canis]
MSRIDLVETFHPLSTAMAVNAKDVAKGAKSANAWALSPRIAEHSSSMKLPGLLVNSNSSSLSSPAGIT